MEQIHTVAWYPMEAEKKERSALGVQTPPKSCFARDPLFLAEEGLSTEMSVNNKSGPLPQRPVGVFQKNNGLLKVLRK